MPSSRFPSPCLGHEPMVFYIQALTYYQVYSGGTPIAIDPHQHPTIPLLTNAHPSHTNPATQPQCPLATGPRRFLSDLWTVQHVAPGPERADSVSPLMTSRGPIPSRQLLPLGVSADQQNHPIDTHLKLDIVDSLNRLV